MKNLLSFIAIIILGWILTYVGPWYLIGLAGFIGGLINRKIWSAFGIGLLAGFCLWLVQIWILKGASPSDLPDRMGELIGVGSGNVLTLISSLIGGLIAAFGAAAGGALLYKKPEKRRRGKKRRKLKKHRRHK